MRRRSGQTLDPLSDDALVSHRTAGGVPPMPDDYDPSIRGNIVHDFNAPRINRNFSHNNAYGGNSAPQDLGRVSPPKVEREHTPVFREHFDDNSSYEQSQAAIRAEQLANKDFITRNSLQPEPSPPPPPPLPKDSPPLPPPKTTSPPVRPPFQTFGGSQNTVSSSMLSPVHESVSPTSVSTNSTPGKRRSSKAPPQARSRATSITDSSFQPAGLPAHMSSRASRFSFQIPGGSDDTQEKLLEDRHKAKEAEKASKQVRMSTNTMADEYDEYDMDDFDMDGGYDEEIPMLGEEDDFGGGLGDQTLDSNINSFDFSSLSIQPNMINPLDPMNHPLRQNQTPIDTNGNPIGFALSENALQEQQVAQGEDLEHQVFQPQTDSLPQKPSQMTTTLDDDMYFDDGMIGDQEGDPADFDEDMFDDPTGPLYDRKVIMPQGDDSNQGLGILHRSETGYDADDDTMPGHLVNSEPSLAHKTSLISKGMLPSHDNMNAYHSALADAATRAEAAGRFTRKASVDTAPIISDLDEDSSVSNSRPSLVPDDGRFSLDTDTYAPYDDTFGMSSSFVDDYDYSDFDSAMEDDPIIAAANAEALAYDDEGFYGQEFGFYPSAVGESPSAWGGFFGPSGIGRSVSGRNAVREPNLTPITERSEYSTRNSFISINHFRDGQQPVSSPGLAQLARMSPYGWPEEEDMSLDALMKLRKGAFGASNASLPGSTSNSPRNSSPMGMQYVPRAASPAGNRLKEHDESGLDSEGSGVLEPFVEDIEDDLGLTAAVNAAYEDEEDYGDDEGDERPESPTLTASDHNSLSSPFNPAKHHDSSNLAPISEAHAQNNVQSPGQNSLMSPAQPSAPASPYGMTLGSPFVPHQRPTAPPSIDTSLSSPSMAMSTSTAPRRQSLGLISPVSTTSPMTPGGSAWRGSHSRKGSAADSVTYVREHDESGEGRWVLERRRTAESGELELIGREIVEGGRI